MSQRRLLCWDGHRSRGQCALIQAADASLGQELESDHRVAGTTLRSNCQFQAKCGQRLRCQLQSGNRLSHLLSTRKGESLWRNSEPRPL